MVSYRGHISLDPVSTRDDPARSWSFDSLVRSRACTEHSIIVSLTNFTVSFMRQKSEIFEYVID